MSLNDISSLYRILSIMVSWSMLYVTVHAAERVSHSNNGLCNHDFC